MDFSYQDCKAIRLFQEKKINMICVRKATSNHRIVDETSMENTRTWDIHVRMLETMISSIRFR